MSQVIHVFENSIDIGGVKYQVQVCGRPSGNIWEGWVEFASHDGEVRRSRRETTQPTREALAYWAGGLSGTYLEGAFARTVERPLPHSVPTSAEPYFRAPAAVTHLEPAADRAILDPFSVATKGEELLRSELGALRAWHLRNIVRVYDLAPASVDLELLSEPELIDLIVTAVHTA